MVRSNDECDVGFLTDWRRLNVMLTRARCGLIVIGNRATLRHDAYLKHWLRWAESEGIILNERSRGHWEPRCLIDTGAFAASASAAVAVADPKPTLLTSRVKSAWSDATSEALAAPSPAAQPVQLDQVRSAWSDDASDCAAA